MICGSGGSQKRRVRSQLDRWEVKSIEQLHTVAARSTFLSQNEQSTQCWGLFWKLWWWRKVHAVVARSTFRSQNVQSTPALKGALLEVAMSKKCTPLWREAHVEVKMYKTHQLRNTFRSCDVETVHAVVARSTFRSQKCKKLTGSEHFWTFRCRFAW